VKADSIKQKLKQKKNLWEIVKKTQSVGLQVLRFSKTVLRKGRFPDFIIIGAQKAGTSSLFHYLSKHPQIEVSLRKEVHFFDRNYDKGVFWYKAHFPVADDGKKVITGEASPYYLFHPLVPGRIKELLPGVKLIVILRDPVDRAYSHYSMQVEKKREPLSFEEAIEKEENRLEGESGFGFAHQKYSYVSRSRYAEQLRRWYELFPKEHLYIMTLEELKKDPEGTLSRLYEFLGVGPASVDTSIQLMRGSYKNSLEEKTRNRLEEYFAPYNRELEELTGRRFDW
jgi:hypothetical protein